MAEQEPKPPEEKKSGLEGIISEFKDFGKKAITIGAIAAMPLLYGFVDPLHIPRAAVTTYGFVAGKATANVMQDKKPLEGTLWQGATGAMLSYPLVFGFQGLNNLETTVASSYGTTAAAAAITGGMVLGLQPTFATMRTSLNYGLGKKFRENWWPSVKNTFKYVSLIGVANVLFISQFGLLAQMATSMVGGYTINLVESLRGKKGSFKNLYKSLRSNVNTMEKLVSNTFYGFFNSAAYLGKGMNELYKKPPLKPV